MERLKTAFRETVECEVYSVKGALIPFSGGAEINLGEVNAYIPIEFEYIGEEVLIGREIMNKLKMYLNGVYTKLTS